MNSVALPASASTPSALSAEAELVRSAARGEIEAFDELYRRHSQPAWRLAQAVAADRDAAVAAFGDGFVSAVRSYRRSRRDPAGGALRTDILAGVYKAALDRAGDSPSPSAGRRAGGSGRRSAPNAEFALADAAFRSLPDRWRAALWLSEVENLDHARIAPVLGVSAAVAGQLVTRGRRALAGRFSQARHEVPDLFGPVLRPLALAMPSGLAGMTKDRMVTARSERAEVVAPVVSWLEDKALRPMSVAVGALLGLGLIGLGVVPQGSAVRGQLGASGATNLNGALPVQATCYGLACPVGTVQGGGFGSAGLTASGGGGTGGASAGSAAASNGVLIGFSAAQTPAPAPAAGSASLPGGGGTTTPSGGGGNYNPPPSTQPAPDYTSIVNTPVASAGTSGVVVVPNSSGSGGLATFNTCGSLSLNSTTVLPCTTTASQPASSSTPLKTSSGSGQTSTVTGTTSAVTGLVSGATSSVTTTTVPASTTSLTTLPAGL